MLLLRNLSDLGYEYKMSDVDITISGTHSTISGTDGTSSGNDGRYDDEEIDVKLLRQHGLYCDMKPPSYDHWVTQECHDRKREMTSWTNRNAAGNQSFHCY